MNDLISELNYMWIKRISIQKDHINEISDIKPSDSEGSLYAYNSNQLGLLISLFSLRAVQQTAALVSLPRL